MKILKKKTGSLVIYESLWSVQTNVLLIDKIFRETIFHTKKKEMYFHTVVALFTEMNIISIFRR